MGKFLKTPLVLSALTALLITGCSNSDNDDDNGLGGSSGPGTTTRTVVGGNSGLRFEDCGPFKLALNVNFDDANNPIHMFGQCATRCDYEGDLNARCDAVTWTVDNTTILELQFPTAANNTGATNFLEYTPPTNGATTGTATVTANVNGASRSFSVEIIEGAIEDLTISDPNGNPLDEEVLAGESVEYSLRATIRNEETGNTEEITGLEDVGSFFLASGSTANVTMSQGGIDCPVDGHAAQFGNCLANTAQGQQSTATAFIQAKYCGKLSQRAELRVRNPQALGTCVLPDDPAVAPTNNATDPQAALNACRTSCVNDNPSAAVQQSNNILLPNGSQQYNMYMFFDDGSTLQIPAADIAWTENDTNITVSSTGLVEASSIVVEALVTGTYTGPITLAPGNSAFLSDSHCVDAYQTDADITFDNLQISPKFSCTGFTGLSPTAGSGESNFTDEQALTAVAEITTTGTCTPTAVCDELNLTNGTMTETVTVAEGLVPHPTPSTPTVNEDYSNANEIAAGAIVNTAKVVDPADATFDSDVWYISEGYWSEDNRTCIDDGDGDIVIPSNVHPELGRARPDSGTPLRLGSSCIRRVHTFDETVGGVPQTVSRVDGATVLTLPAIDDGLLLGAVPLLELCESGLEAALAPLNEQLLFPLGETLTPILAQLDPLGDPIGGVVETLLVTLGLAESGGGAPPPGGGATCNTDPTPENFQNCLTACSDQDPATVCPLPIESGGGVPGIPGGGGTPANCTANGVEDIDPQNFQDCFAACFPTPTGDCPFPP